MTIAEIMTALKAINADVFTVADTARLLKLDPKVARRRVRGNAARDKNAQMKMPTAVKAPTRANRVHEFKLTQANVEAVIAVIQS